MIIDRKQIEGLEPVAEGYKIFNNDWTANYGNNYCYADENGNVEGVVHKQEGVIRICTNGFHFCESPLDCFNHYPCIQWNKFAQVKGYGQISRDNDSSKVAVEILEIIKVLTFDEFIEEIKKYNNCDITDDISYSNGVSKSHAINNSKGIDCSRGINSSRGINRSNGVSYSNGVNHSSGVICSNGVSNSCGISNSTGISGSIGTHRTYNTSCSWGINESYGIKNSCGIHCSYGIENSYGVCSCLFIKNCLGISNSIFCINTTGTNMIFNKSISFERINSILRDIKLIFMYWHPKFTNAEELILKNNYWEYTPANKIIEVTIKEAYKDMPKELIEYFKSLPEFDAKIFKEITGIEA